MDVSQSALEPVFATALVSFFSSQGRELSFERGDLIQVQRDLGDGVVLGSNVSQGSTTGTIRLRNIELNRQTQNLEATQLAVEELLAVRREYEAIRASRELMQAEVASLYEEKEELTKHVNPIRYSLRSLDDLLRHLVQTDIESIEVAELVREAQNEWTSIVGEINRLQASVDDPELDPFRRLVLDRCDGLKKRVASLVGPATETLSICKMLHVDLENVANAFCGRPLLPRPTRTAVEHARTSSQGSLSSSSSSITSPASIKGHISSISSPNGISSPTLSRIAGLTHKPMGGSLSNLPEYVPPSTTQHVGSDFFPQNDSLIRSQTATGLTSPSASPIPKHLDRTALLGGQRSRGSSPSLFQGNSSVASSSSSPTTSPPPITSPTLTGTSKFIFCTKPSSLKFEAPDTSLNKSDGAN